MTAFRDSQDKVCGVVVIPKRNQDTFGRDIEDMQSFLIVVAAPALQFLACVGEMEKGFAKVAAFFGSIWAAGQFREFRKWFKIGRSPHSGA
jgi:hypothetical protein